MNERNVNLRAEREWVGISETRSSADRVTPIETNSP